MPKNRQGEAEALIGQYLDRLKVRADILSDLQRQLDFAVDALTPMVEDGSRFSHQTVVSLSAIALIAVNQARTDAEALVTFTDPNQLQ